METVNLPHLKGQPMRLGLFEDVSNAASLRQKLLDGDSDFEYAFLDASVLLSRRHVFAACFRAIGNFLDDQMKSRNVHSEIVFCLSANNNIAESFRRFGISDETKNIVAIKVGGDAGSVDDHLARNIDGRCVALTDDRLRGLRDASRLKKAYRIDIAKEKPDVVEAYVLGSIALRGS